MAAVTKRSNKFQIRVRHELLSKPFFFTFDTEYEARSYAARLEGLLDRGIVPMELTKKDESKSSLVTGILGQYALSASRSDRELVTYVNSTIDPLMRLSDVTSLWADQWVDLMKSKRLSPGSIRKRVGCLARAIDAHIRLLPRGTTLPSNVMRMLPRGYSTYNIGRFGEDAPIDVERDRILSDDELQTIRDTLLKLEGNEIGRYRSDPYFGALFWLIYYTGLRLRAAYTVESSQIDMVKHLITFKDKGNGNKRKPRFVPIQPALRAILYPLANEKSGLLFPYWSGLEAELDKTSNRLKQRFTTLFRLAKIEDVTEHDLRHCATNNWLKMKSATGNWLFSETEVIKIMGWTSSKMLLRYASVRGEDLSGRFD